MISFQNNIEQSAIRICIDSLEKDFILEGKIITERERVEKTFLDVQNLLLQIEDTLSASIYPDAEKKLRKFQKERRKEKTFKGNQQVEEKNMVMEKEMLRGNLLTIILYVVQRRNVTWQGRIYCLETGAVKNFKSELDLLKQLKVMIGTTIVENKQWKKAL